MAHHTLRLDIQQKKTHGLDNYMASGLTHHQRVYVSNGSWCLPVRETRVETQIRKPVGNAESCKVASFRMKFLETAVPLDLMWCRRWRLPTRLRSRTWRWLWSTRLLLRQSESGTLETSPRPLGRKLILHRTVAHTWIQKRFSNIPLTTLVRLTCTLWCASDYPWYRHCTGSSFATQRR